MKMPDFRPAIRNIPARKGCSNAERLLVITILALVVAASSAARAIPPYRLTLQQVLSRPCRVGVARLLEASSAARSNGHEVICRLVVERMLGGRAVPATLRATYFESFPYRAPDGKVEAPIYTGSGLEHELTAGERYLFIVEDESPEVLLRIEPFAREAEIRALLSPR